MARQQFIVRHGRLINRVHTDQDYPYRYQGDPHRWKAQAMAKAQRLQAKIDIKIGLEDYLDER